ncbi:tRNA 2-selenouridine(34) synthase MnmH [Spirosoma pomorum]
MIKTISVADFWALKQQIVLADVRTPAEFEHGHVPGAVNLPLFSNEERVQVGTTYKQVGREQAILLGFDLTGAKWSGFIKQALEWAPDKRIALHCWRGGMRSGAMAWALNLYGFEVYLIEGGYKAYRGWVRIWFEKKYPLWVIGGMTGSGKTKLLYQLTILREQVIDLEELAQHQGSAYGSMGKLVQPSQEQFENNLAEQLSGLDQEQTVWVEDESLMIGKLFVPKPFWQQMQQAPMADIRVDLEQRVGYLAEEYGRLDKEFLIASTQRIQKRLGPLQTKQTIEAILDDRMADFVRLVLVYYDKTYRTALNHRSSDTVFPLEIGGEDRAADAHKLIELSKTSSRPVAESISQPDGNNPY